MTVLVNGKNDYDWMVYVHLFQAVVKHVINPLKHIPMHYTVLYWIM